MNSDPKTVFEKYYSQLHCALGLNRQPVAVSFFFTQNDYENAKEQQCVSTASYCTMVRSASLGHGRKATVEHVKCPGATRALGLTPPDENYLSGMRYHSLGLYKDIECAKETTEQVSIMGKTIYGFSVQPLSTCDSPPDVVILICNPNQAMRVIQGCVYNYGIMQQMCCIGNQGVCSELTARPFQTQKINVSLLCSGTRYSCAWDDGELGVGIPFVIFSEIVEGVISTINSAEPDKKKHAIIERMNETGVGIDIKLGSAYFLPKKAK